MKDVKDAVLGPGDGFVWQDENLTSLNGFDRVTASVSAVRENGSRTVKVCYSRFAMHRPDQAGRLRRLAARLIEAADYLEGKG